MAKKTNTELTDDVKKHFGAKLKRIRKSAGYRFAKQLAQAIGEESHTYTAWERGDHLPDLVQMTKLCRVLRADPAELLPINDVVRQVRSHSTKPKAA